MVFSTPDSALSKKAQETAASPDSPPSVLKPLVSELQYGSQSGTIRFEHLEPLLVRLMKSCHQAKDVALQVSTHLLVNQDMLRSLLFLANSAMKGKYQNERGRHLAVVSLASYPGPSGGGKKKKGLVYCLRMRQLRNMNTILNVMNTIS
jgi:hypothetical protein